MLYLSYEADSLYYTTKKSIMCDIGIMRDIVHCLYKKNRALPDYAIQRDLSLPVSRVLSCTVIYLGLPSPISSSDVHGESSDGQPY